MGARAAFVGGLGRTRGAVLVVRRRRCATKAEAKDTAEDEQNGEESCEEGEEAQEVRVVLGILSVQAIFLLLALLRYTRWGAIVGLFFYLG